MEAELNDYNRLKEIGIRIPALIDADIKNKRILKELLFVIRYGMISPNVNR